MAATTLADFVTAAQGVTVPGVRRTFPTEPGSVTTADLPALWIHKARRHDPPAGRSGMNWPTLTATVFLVVSPVSQGLQAWAQVVAFADALTQALRAADLAKGQTTVTAETETLIFNEKRYWGVVASVEAQG